MVYCKKLVDGKCEFTGGKCILKNPKTIEDYKVCPERKLAKDYNEMTQSEKALYNSIRNQKKICDLVDEIGSLWDKIYETGKKFDKQIDVLHDNYKYLKEKLDSLQEKPEKRGIFKRLFSRK
jgi:hypothetical protein